MAPELSSALLGACSSAVRPRVCVLGSDPSVPADATVTWESTSSARVRVRSGGPTENERTLRFRPEDREEDRYDALGLVVAALVGKEAPTTDSTEGQPPGPAAESTPPPESPARFWMALGVLTGRGLVGGPARYGGFLRLAYRFREVPLFVVAEVAPSEAPAGPADVEPGFLPVSLGFGGAFTVDGPSLALRPRLDGVIERQTLSRRGPPADEGSRYLDGLRFGLECAWPERFPVAVVLGFSGQALSGATAARVGGKKVTSFPADSYTLTLGIEAHLFR